MSIGVSSIAIPSAIAQEGSSIRWPLFGFDFAIGLPHDFILQGIFSTQVVTNHLEANGRWVATLTEKLHADVGLGTAFWFGQLKQFGFNTNVHGWMTYPSVSIGYDFGPVAVTAQGKISILNSISLRTEGLESQVKVNTFNGFSYRLSAELPFYKTTTVGLAFQMNYLKFYYPEWPLFPAFDYYFWIPEGQVWISL